MLVQQHGADGTMGAGAVLGRELPDYFNAIWENDLPRARRLGERNERLMRAWFNADYTGRFGSGQAIFKAALNELGLPGGYPRRPLLPLEEHGLSIVRQTLTSSGQAQSAGQEGESWLTAPQRWPSWLPGIVSGGIRVVDLTVPLEPATPTIQLPPIFAPSKPFALEEISKYDERGPAWYWNNIACGEHTGTHFDAPIHWVTGKDYPNNATHNIPVQKFIGPACVIDVTDRVRENVDFLVTVEVVKAWEVASTARFRAARGC